MLREGVLLIPLGPQEFLLEDVDLTRLLSVPFSVFKDNSSGFFFPVLEDHRCARMPTRKVERVGRNEYGWIADLPDLGVSCRGRLFPLCSREAKGLRMKRIITVSVALFLAACSGSPVATVGPEEDATGPATVAAADLGNPTDACPGPSTLFLTHFLARDPTNEAGEDWRGYEVVNTVYNVEASQTTTGPSKHEITLGFKVGLGTSLSGPSVWIDEERTTATVTTPGCQVASSLARFRLDVPDVQSNGPPPPGAQRWWVFVQAVARGTATADGKTGNWEETRTYLPVLADIPDEWVVGVNGDCTDEICICTW